MKEQIIKLWRTIERPGVEKLIEYLEESDFFTAPCSTHHHLAKPGGLVEHSLNVYELLEVKYSDFYGLSLSSDAGVSSLTRFDFSEITTESIIICALGHDLCKVNYYGTETKWRKDANGRWESYDAYCVKDQLPLGHGEKSVSILQDFIRLTNEEKLAIRWHMGPWDMSEPGRNAFNVAKGITPLVVLLSTADFEATNIIEK